MPVGGLAGGLRRISDTTDSIQRLSVTHQRMASRPGMTPTPAPSGEVPVVYGPFDGAGGFAAYNPRTGEYARGGVVDGLYDSRALTTRESKGEVLSNEDGGDHSADTEGEHRSERLRDWFEVDVSGYDLPLPPAGATRQCGGVDERRNALAGGDSRLGIRSQSGTENCAHRDLSLTRAADISKQSF